MRRALLRSTASCILAAGVLSASIAHGQPADLPIAAADGQPLPAGISIRKDKAGSVYVDREGRVLYGMDMRTVLRWAANPAKYCTDACRADWDPVLAPAGTTVNISYPRAYRNDATKGMINPQKAPDWTVIAGNDGPQWVYKGWHMVYTRHADPRSIAYDGADNRTWNTLKYIPAPPAVKAMPAALTTRFVDGRYVLADGEGRLLFTGTCKTPCAWKPLAAPMASKDIPDWKVSSSGDTAQWLHKSKPVFVTEDSDPAGVPEGGTLVQP